MEEKMTNEELIKLVTKICNGDYASKNDYYHDLDIFMKNVPDSEALDLIYYHKLRLTPKEIVEKALAKNSELVERNANLKK